ncbi:MAG: DUF3494 domain-containing protein [Bacteriovorax sp.]|nr:DUF3494 domain-containing protein [Bacteriovorax sp.]
MNNKIISSRFSTIASTALTFSLVALIGCGTDSNGSLVFNPRNPFGAGPAAVSLSKTGSTNIPGDMGSAGSYVILAKTGISNVTGSVITGDIGVSPAAESYITGFSLVADATNVFSTSSSVVGKVYSANSAVPTPTNLTTAIGTVETAYTNAAGRNPPDFNELSTGNLGGLNLVPGLYKWTNNVNISTDVTITGSATDVWIFQVAGNLTMASAVNITLAGGALPENIYWQVAGAVTIGTTSHFEGIMLCKTAVVFGNLATMNGRIFAQTAVNLDNNTIHQP